MNNDSPKGISPVRLALLSGVLVLGVLVLLWRIVDLHVFNKTFLQEQGDARYLRVVAVPAHRGMILDRNGVPLAISTPVDSVWADPQEFRASARQWVNLSRLLDISVDSLRRSLAQQHGRSFAYLKRQIAPALAHKVMALDITGLALRREYRRYYPSGAVTAHVLGFTNVDDVGQEGLELAYNNWLRGTPGSKRVIKDRLGHIVQNVESIREPRPGKNLTLSIDLRIQSLAYRELRAAVLRDQARSGSVVVLNAHTGEVLAMVNQPAYNPNNRDDLHSARLRNRAVTDVFEPGSSIKPFTIAAALQDGRYTPDTLINTSPGYYRLAGHMIRDVSDFGLIDVSTVIQKSSNVGASKISLSIPPADLWNMLTRAGFGETTGSGFPGESAGLLNYYTHWRKIERATLAYGYGLAVTPLQLAHAYTAIADAGCMPPISFLRENKAPDCRRVMTAKTAREVLRMMERVVHKGGTGVHAEVPGYKVAGKTGTVKQAVDGGYAADRYVAVFAGMAPATDPRLVMAVVISDPRHGSYYGGLVAAPVFERIMAGALRLLDIAPDNLPVGTTRIALRESRS